jgi:hypothetical protein
MTPSEARLSFLLPELLLWGSRVLELFVIGMIRGGGYLMLYPGPVDEAIIVIIVLWKEETPVRARTGVLLPGQAWWTL